MTGESSQMHPFSRNRSTPPPGSHQAVKKLTLCDVRTQDGVFVQPLALMYNNGRELYVGIAEDESAAGGDEGTANEIIGSLP